MKERLSMVSGQKTLRPERRGSTRTHERKEMRYD